MNYIAYTIGPIYETIFNTLKGENKTKKLRAGSYFFSLFMKSLLENIKDDFTILVPFVSQESLQKSNQNLGIFHDRFIASFEFSKDDAKEKFNKHIKNTFDSLAKDIPNATSNELQKNMQNHLLIASQEELKEIDENIIFAINKILDAKELSRSFSFNKELNHIATFQEEQVKKSKVKTIEDISKKIGFNYYAVITADGDKMGAKIRNEATENPSNITTLSQKLFEFFANDDNIYDITNLKYGGELIYAGGDDILAFLPVKNGETTFLEYIKELDNRFKELVGEDVSLSFGVNIAYYKYPLKNAIESAFELLHNAKNSASNSIALKITKHSGQTFESIFNLNSQEYEKFKTIIEGVIKDAIRVPHSLHHSLKRYENSIISCFSNENSSLEELFLNIFNDKSKEDKLSLKQIEKFINTVEPKTEQEFNKIFSALSIIKFLREDRV